MLRKFIVVMSLAVAALGITDAQSRSVGTTWSFSGIGLSYESVRSDDVIFHAGVQLEMTENFLGRRGKMGWSGTVVWSNIIARTESRNGNEVLFHAGPGIMAGYAKDLQRKKGEDQYGVTFGLQGRVGATMIYDRKINISICIAPVIGMHLTRTDENLNMKYYRYGLLRTIMPEVSLQYRF